MQQHGLRLRDAVRRRGPKETEGLDTDVTVLELAIMYVVARFLRFIASLCLARGVCRLGQDNVQRGSIGSGKEHARGGAVPHPVSARPDLGLRWRAKKGRTRA